MKKKTLIDWREAEALRRFQIIQRLTDQTMDHAKRVELRKKISEDNDISERTLQRWEKAFFECGFSGLKPKSKDGYQSKRLPENFPELLQEAIQLKREVITRSVEQIILILELEGRAAPGVLKRSTLQRYLHDAGFSTKQLQIYREDEPKRAVKRFCKPHRMMLVQADIKYGTGILLTINGRKKTAYLSSIIDDHSRYILWSEWYETQNEYSVQDVFRKAILKCGKFDKAYCDNGSQYISRQLKLSMAMLGIGIKHAPMKSGKSKGKVEKFHQVVDKFIAEIKLKKTMDIAEVNRYWQIFLEEYYHQRSHSGIAEYYKSIGVIVPDKGITPEQEWNRDTRPLVFLDAKVIGEAFLNHEERTVDKGGLISFKGRKYEAGASLIGCKVTIAYDPMNDSSIIVSYKDIPPFTAEPVVIGEYCSKALPVPTVISNPPATSRFLDALEKKYNQSQKKLADAISYSDYGKEEN